MQVIQVPVLSDNYSYLIVDSKKNALSVDPANPAVVLDAAKHHQVTIRAILTTHHHSDHAGGNKMLNELLGSKLPVYGGDDRIPALTKHVKHDDSFEVGELHVRVLSTPCHTKGHVLYYVTSLVTKDTPGALFSGDTLFLGGCGRFFEGNAEQMHHALCEVIPGLPHETQVYCGHEYTVKNLQFALTVEPDNEALKAKLAWAQRQRERGLSTIPATIAEELQYNPFMRVAQPSVAKAVGLKDPVAVMGELRKRKDHF